jgi:serine/threonine protein kinase
VTDPSPAPSRSRGYYLGRYEVVKHLGAGSMGAVYKATDSETGRVVALKVLPPQYAANPLLLKRFQREAKHGQRLNHENIAGIYEFTNDKDTYFQVMEFVDGVNLHEYVFRKGTLSAAEARAITIQVARALDHAHQQGIIHRDIKPSNILLAQSEGRMVAKVIDLGLSRIINEDEFRLTRDGTTVGTVNYLPPEQARNSGSADIRSDIYALGCTLYHMLAGDAPFPDGSLAERIYKHAEAEPPDLRPRVPNDLWQICRRMLAKRPEDRYQTPADLLADLESRAPVSGGVVRGEVVGEEKRSGDVSSIAGRRSLPPVRTPEPKSPGTVPMLHSRSAAGAQAPATVPVFSPPPPPPAHDRDTSLQVSGHNTLVAEAPSPATLEQRQVAQGQFQRAAQVIADGNYEYGSQLLVACCQLDPTNLLYRNALRQAYPQLAALQRGGFRGWCKLLALKFRLYVAENRGEHLRVLHWGEEVLRRQPDNYQVQLDMAHAAENLGFFNLAVWLLEQIKKDTFLARANRALALLYEKQGDYPRAISLWEQVARSDPGNIEAKQKFKDLAARDTIVRGNYAQRSAVPPPPPQRKSGLK